ncbi:MAG: TIGR00159 family protein [Clostridiales bacterium]|nr:TIGR00159 family protein [Clostridiales bacterium]
MSWETLKNSLQIQVANLGLTDVVDILIVSFLIYQVIKFVRRSRALPIIKGILLLVLLQQVGLVFDLDATGFLLRNTMQLGVMAIIVVFQPELRSVLEQMGRRRLGGSDLLGDKGTREEGLRLLREISDACEHLSQARVGALIVFERGTDLGDILGTGIALDAAISSELIESIFFVNNPLHDGAVFIRGDRVAAASCLLPLTQNQNLSKELGTRHRAAIGLSEVSDALVVVVSEETGKISIVQDGLIRRGYRGETLQEALSGILLSGEEEAQPGLWQILIKALNGKGASE